MQSTRAFLRPPISKWHKPLSPSTYRIISGTLSPPKINPNNLITKNSHLTESPFLMLSMTKPKKEPEITNPSIEINDISYYPDVCKEAYFKQTLNSQNIIIQNAQISPYYFNNNLAHGFHYTDSNNNQHLKAIRCDTEFVENKTTFFKILPQNLKIVITDKFLLHVLKETYSNFSLYYNHHIRTLGEYYYTKGKINLTKESIISTIFGKPIECGNTDDHVHIYNKTFDATEPLLGLVKDGILIGIASHTTHNQIALEEYITKECDIIRPLNNPSPYKIGNNEMYKHWA